MKKKFNGTGSTNPMAKFSPDQIKEIRTNPEKLTQRQMAAKYGVHQCTISYAKTGKTYADVEA